MRPPSAIRPPAAREKPPAPGRDRARRDSHAFPDAAGSRGPGSAEAASRILRHHRLGRVSRTCNRRTAERLAVRRPVEDTRVVICRNRLRNGQGVPETFDRDPLRPMCPLARDLLGRAVEGGLMRTLLVILCLTVICATATWARYAGTAPALGDAPGGAERSPGANPTRAEDRFQSETRPKTDELLATAVHDSLAKDARVNSMQVQVSAHQGIVRL